MSRQDDAHHPGAAFRGQPLLALCVVLAGWTAFRMVTFDVPASFAIAEPPSPLMLPGKSGPSAAGDAGLQIDAGATLDHAGEGVLPPGIQSHGTLQPSLLPPVAPARPAAAPAALPVWKGALLTPSASGAAPYGAHGDPPGTGNAGVPVAAARLVVGHNLLLAAGLSSLPMPTSFAALYRKDDAAPQAQLAATTSPIAAPVPYLAAAPAAAARRWSADGWLYWRSGSGGQLAALQPSYGRSQAGAVVRFDLAPRSGQRPQAYLRGNTALQGPREQEAALGLSVRPVATVPMRVGGEMRVRDGAYGSEVRPAVLAVTELPPLTLARGVEAEAYAQGGYVGGRFATPFVDAQARAMVDVSEFGGSRLSAGAGVWGGAQKGAARIDVGPSAALRFRLGAVNSRLALDYRLRVAGDAQPASGPALTLSAGF